MSLALTLRQAWLRYKAHEGQEFPQKHLGVLVGEYLGLPPVTEMTISRWMAGKAHPNPAEFLAVCAVLELDTWRAAGVRHPLAKDEQVNGVTRIGLARRRA